MMPNIVRVSNPRRPVSSYEFIQLISVATIDVKKQFPSLQACKQKSAVMRLKIGNKLK